MTRHQGKTDGAPDHGNEIVVIRTQSRSLSRRLTEFGIVSAFGLLFFFILLWILSVGFPHSTGIGDLIRQRDVVDRGSDRLHFDATGDAQPIVAVLSDVHRNVKDKPAHSVTWTAAALDTQLMDRHSVQTSAHSSAAIRFGDATPLELGENSLITVRNRSVRQRGPRRTSLIVLDGTLRGTLGGTAREADALELIAGSATIKRGSTGDAGFSLTVDENRSTTFAVYDGAAEVNWSGKVTVVPANHSVEFSQSKPPGRPRMLPPTPTLMLPPNEARFSYRAAPPRISFSWVSEDTSQGRIQIARDAAFEEIVHDQRVAQSQFVHGNLTDGRFYWRISGLRGEAESPMAEHRAFDVVLDRDPPELRVDFPDGAVEVGPLVLRGATDVGTQVLIDNLSVPTSESGEFAHVVQLRPGFNKVVVHAIDPAGNTTFLSDLIRARNQASKRTP